MEIVGARIRDIHSLCSTMEKQNDQKTSYLKVNIPHYQRPYTWGKSDGIDDNEETDSGLIVKLFQDFFDNYDENAEDSEHNTYFAGMIVAVKNVKDDVYNIIDGQQRLTTIFLLNIISFICKLNYIDHIFKEGTYGKYETELKDFCDFYLNNICSNNEIEVKAFLKKMELLVSDKDEAKITKTLKNEFKKIFPIELERTKYQESVEKFLKNKTLALNYEYMHYNELLKEIISKTRIYIDDTDLSIDIDPEIENIEISKAYTNALTIIFEQIKIYLDKLSSYEGKNIYKSFSDLIKVMTDNIKVCVLLAESEEDAYTLFEVVNDRSMPLETIDLIKNAFYRHYVNYSKEKDKDIDEHIDALNKVWNESFKDFEKEQRDFVLLIAISYITHIYVNNKDNKNYKDALKKYFNKETQYTYKDICRDFDIINSSAELYKLFYSNRIKKISLNSSSISSELENKVHLFYKVFHMLRAFKQDNVIPALTNIILKKYYITKEHNKHLKMVEYFSDLKKSKIGEDKDIDLVSKDLNKLSLCGIDYKLPLDYAKHKIENDDFQLTAEMSANANEQYEKWIEEWKKGKNDIRIKILFNRLYTFENNNGLIEKGGVVHFLRSTRQELDHLDAKKIAEGDSDFYYNPSKGINRGDIINSLGNMMILDKGYNIKKSNKCLEEGLDRYIKNYTVGEKGNCHWIVNEIIELLKEYHIDVPKGKRTIKVPTIDFFNERKKRLINYFKQVIDKSELI